MLQGSVYSIKASSYLPGKSAGSLSSMSIKVGGGGGKEGVLNFHVAQKGPEQEDRR